jgi:hypothetical protein
MISGNKTMLERSKQSSQRAINKNALQVIMTAGH